MRIPESFFDIIGIFVGVSLGMMDAVIIRPGRSGASKSEASEQEIKNFHDRMRLVSPVCEESMISCSDTQTGKDIETNTHHKCSPAKRARKEIKRSQNNQ